MPKNNKRIRALVLSFWLITSTIFLPAQENDIYLDYLNVETGLPNNEVTAITQDKYGFIWIGTRGGLNRFDAYEYIQFRNNIRDSNSLVNNSIECLEEDGNFLWIGTKSGGLSRYDLRKESFTNFQYDPYKQNSLSENRIISIFVDSKHRKWIGTNSNGLNSYNETSNTFKRYLEGAKINKVLEDSLGQIWTVTNRGLFLFNEEENFFETLPLFPNLIGGIEDIILKGSKLILSTWSGDIIQVDIRSKAIISHSPFSASPDNKKGEINISRLFCDNKGRIYIGTWGDGLYILEAEGQFKKIDLAPVGARSSVAFNVILDIFQDKAGSIWIGTNSGGIVRLMERTTKFNSLDLDSVGSQALKELHVNSIYKDSQHNIWLATRGKGVFVQKEGEKKLTSFSLPFYNNLWKVAYSFLEDEKGNIWIGTSQGVYILDPNHQIKKHLTRDQTVKSSLSGNKITSLYKDSKGIIWVGTQQKGFNKLLEIRDENYVFQRYTAIPEQDGGLNNSRITCFEEEKSGKIWIGTYGGLHLFDPAKDSFTNYKVSKKKDSGISSNIITSLKIDRSNNLWIGTPNGINHLNLNNKNTIQFKAYFEEDGLPDSYIHAIQSDDQGHIWISTNKGISNFNPLSLEFRNFDLSNGLSSLSYSENGSFIDGEGLIYFGGAKGLSVFNPEEIEDNTLVPKIALTALSINDNILKVGDAINGRMVLNNSILETKNLKLKNKDRVISFQFTALNYIAAQNNRFKYQLEGYDNDWMEANSLRTATYTELAPGNYTFKVIGSNNSNIWNKNPIALDIKVAPSPWESTLAKILYALFIIGLLFTIQRVTITQQRLRQALAIEKVKTEKEVELHEMKSQFFTNVSHEIRTPLTLIAGPIEELLLDQKLDGSVRQKLTSVQLNTAHLKRLVSQLLAFRKTEQNQQRLKAARGNFALFCEEIYLSFKAYAASKRISFQFSKEADFLELWYDRPKFEIILSNLLLNAFKHTPENGSVSLKLEHGNTAFALIKIKDSGNGIPTDKQAFIFDRFYQVTNSKTVNIAGSGIGLSLVKDLLHLHGGQVSLISKAGEGTEFTLMIPKGCAHLKENQIVKDYKNSSHPFHYQLAAITLENSKPSSQKKDNTILLVEDNSNIRNFLRSIFKNEYNILEAENGRLGLVEAQSKIPDLILSDVMMPEMDGISLCESLKSNIATNHIPVILLTARSTDYYKIKGLNSGADDYITKPFLVAEIKAKVKNQLLLRENLKVRFSNLVSLEPSEIEILNRDELFITQAISFIEKNLDNHEMGADLLAKALGMSQSTLYRKLKAMTGQSISNFIKAIRLKIAAQYLVKSSHSIKEIAYLTGFNDAKYFRKCFVEQFSIRPSEFKKNRMQELIPKEE